MKLTDQDIEAIARRIAGDLRGAPAPAAPPPAAASAPAASPADYGDAMGVFNTVDEAVAAARAAFPVFSALSIEKRAAVIASIRAVMRENATALAKSAYEETGYGRFEDKILKNQLVIERTPGTEDLPARAFTGDHGLTLIEYAPFGVLGAITPTTNPTSTIICNAIGMLAAGNVVVFNVHPSAKRCSVETVALLNKAIIAAGGPANAAVCVGESSIESAGQLMKHPGIRVLVVTGGGGVVKAAMESGKRAMCAGPGNPPVVVDETADIDKAAADLVFGAAFDNNMICIEEKETVVVASVADRLIKAMQQNNAVLIDPSKVAAMEQVIFSKMAGPREHATINRKWIGQNADKILAEIGISAPATTRLGIVELPEDHPLFWTEQMLPIMPVCRAPNVDYAIDLAIQMEGGNFHTAIMHSKNIDKLSKMARACNCSIFVKNARSQAGLGFGGEGYTSFTIASPTGEGLTTARSFSRERRCTLADHFRIV
ncbi:MAG: aldehyde dehydrogenase EutE [Lentisphaerae bacterium]|jgi:acyl-CoA reductase-like NAD-dependent aldehyde dehydrogenase|nr:aldehyde dehydrogenase EutE [Lentisphaerota bacterium]